MKRILLIIGAFLVIASCVWEQGPAPEEKGENHFAFTASLGDVTKATISDEGKAAWSAGDRIAVYDALGGTFCTFTSEAGDGHFYFTGEPGKKYDFTSARYPADVVLSTTAVALPAAYTENEAQAGTVFPMKAEAHDGHLSFHHLGALLKIVLRNVPDEARTLLVQSPTVSLSGEFTLEPSGLEDGREVIRAQAGEAGVEVSLTPGNHKKTVYVPLPLGTYAVKLTLKSETDTILEYTTEGEKEIQRSKLILLNPIDFYDGEGSGTAEDPYRIVDVENLVALSEAVSATGGEHFRQAHYIQTADIDLSGIANFPPIGSMETPFAGTYNGNGHTISNLTIDQEENSAGLFGYLNGGTVKNVSLVKASVKTAKNYAGGITGVLYSGHIVGCRMDAESIITAGVRGAGSFAGLVRSGVIDSCASHGGVYAGTDVAGGIAGYVYPNAEGHDALIINCTFEPVYKDGTLYTTSATVQTGATNAYMGGIVGSANVGTGRIRIVNCYSYPLRLRTTLASGASLKYVGGIVGRSVDGDVRIYNCITPVTYSNVIFSGTRLNAKTYADYPDAACIVGTVSKDGTSIGRVFSKNTWPVSFNAASGITVNTSDITLKMGDSNMRGYGDCVFSSAYTITGTKNYTVADGGVLAALNEGVSLWNAENPLTPAAEWAYDPTFGYPKPAGVDVPGVVTRKVSLIGDSISTYQGYIFSTDDAQMNKFYPDAGNSYTNMVLNEQATWWWKIIFGKMNNARLEVCNAFGGSTVTYTETKIEGMAKEPNDRMQQNSLQKRYLDYGLGAPDILFYHGGRNDFGQFGGNTDVLLGAYDKASLQAAYDAPAGTLFNNYSAGTVAILRDFHQQNPQAKVLMIVHDMMSDGYDAAAAAIAKFLSGNGFDIRCVSLHEPSTNNKTNTTLGITKEGGTHPNAEGCTNMANYIFEQLGDWLESPYVPGEPDDDPDDPDAPDISVTEEDFDLTEDSDNWQ